MDGTGQSQENLKRQKRQDPVTVDDGDVTKSTQSLLLRQSAGHVFSLAPLKSGCWFGKAEGTVRTGLSLLSPQWDSQIKVFNRQLGI